MTPECRAAARVPMARPVTAPVVPDMRAPARPANTLYLSALSWPVWWRSLKALSYTRSSSCSLITISTMRGATGTRTAAITFPVLTELALTAERLLPLTAPSIGPTTHRPSMEPSLTTADRRSICFRDVHQT